MKFTKEKLHRTAVSYIEHFLDDVRHIKNRLVVKTVIAAWNMDPLSKLKYTGTLLEIGNVIQNIFQE